jgi:hypothetical protein
VPGGLIEYFLASHAGLAEVLYQLDGACLDGITLSDMA